MRLGRAFAKRIETSDRTSACSRTVGVARSCLSGGVAVLLEDPFDDDAELGSDVFALRPIDGTMVVFLLKSATSSKIYIPEGKVSAGSPRPFSAIGSKGSTALVWSKWMIASNWSESRA